MTRLIGSWPTVLGLSVLVTVLVVVRLRYTRALVCGHSMSPTYRDGERVLAVRQHGYQVGDVIVFRPPFRPTHHDDLGWRIKRVAAVTGDPVPSWLSVEDMTVPPNRVLVVGDNPNSEDSRQLGYIDTALVAGRVIRRLPRVSR